MTRRVRCNPLALSVLLLAVLLLVACRAQKDPRPRFEREDSGVRFQLSNTYDYSVIDHKVVDTEDRAQVTVSVAVSSEHAHNDLGPILAGIYDQVDTLSGFQFFDRPSHIDVFAYMRDDSGRLLGDGAVAEIVREGVGSQPRCFFDYERLLEARLQAPTRQGLSEEKRLEIWNEYVWSEDRGAAIAEKIVPETKSLVERQRRITVRDSLRKVFKFELADHYGISFNDLELIMREGMIERWPLPDQQSPLDTP